MKKGLLIISLTLFIPIASHAANILMWHYDFADGDIYQDPEAGQQIRCDYWIKKSLDANGYTYEYHNGTTLPADISSYDAIVGTLGYYGC